MACGDCGEPVLRRASLTGAAGGSSCGRATHSAESYCRGGAMPGAELHDVHADRLAAGRGRSARTTGSSRPRASSWASRRRPDRAADILTAAVAGWAAGAMSMAAGEYVSVSSQADSERADLAREPRSARERRRGEARSSPRSTKTRGVKPSSRARSPASSWPRTRSSAHARDELGFRTSAHSPGRSRPPRVGRSPSRSAPRRRR